MPQLLKERTTKTNINTSRQLIKNIVNEEFPFLKDNLMLHDLVLLKLMMKKN